MTVPIDVHRFDAVLFDLDGVVTDTATVTLVKRLQAAGVGTAVYSASRNCRAVLRAAGIGDLFSTQVDGSDAEKLGLPSKPDPAVLLEAARRVGAEPARCVVVEDAESGVIAGRRGGFGLVVGVHRTGSNSTVPEFGADVLVSDLAEVTVLDEDPWAMAFEGYRPGSERLREALCTVGNGYFATRGCSPESDAGEHHYPGTYCAGIFNRLSDMVSGNEIDNESMVNLPNWLPLSFRVDDGPWFDIDTVEVLSYRQRMNLRCAELIREIRFRDADGRVSRLTQRRFVSMADPHVAALQTTLVPENYSGTVEFSSTIDPGVRNAGVARYAGLSDAHLTVTESAELGDDGALVVAETVQSRIRLAVATRTRCWQGNEPVDVVSRFCDTATRVGHHISLPVRCGRPVTVEKAAMVVTGRDAGISEPAGHVRKRLPGLGRYAELRGTHRTEWDRLWQRLDIGLEDFSDQRRVLRFHLMHLVQTVSPHTADLDAGVPARGLHGEAYRGHIFWDELFVFPVLNLRMPAVTRSLLRYRYRRLDEARGSARLAGHRGAMFPWQSGSDGREESQRLHLNPLSGRWNPDASARAHHIGIAVAYNVWQYYQTTADLEFLVDCGAEMIVEIARFWVSLAELDGDRGRYVIRGVIGPDEFHSGYPDRPFDGIDNNAYTNVMAVWVVTRALEALAILSPSDRQTLLAALDLTDTELARFDDVTRRMFVPFHDGVISQFDGYERLAELDWERYRQRYGDISRLDRILESESDDVNRYRAAKQADVLMLLYLLSADELREILARLGYPLSPKQIPRTVDYYLRRTSHGSTLSALVHTWVLARGQRYRALTFFEEVLRSDIDDVQGGTTAEGIHLAAMAGSVDLVLRCLTGLEIRGDRLVLSPMWPESLGVLEFPIQYRNHSVRIRISGAGAELTAGPGQTPPITVECRGRVEQLGAGGTVRFDGTAFG